VPNNERSISDTPRNLTRMNDPHRPIAHLLPVSGWTNDPIGPVRWRGRTHLFSQVNPAGPFWDRPHWGHFVTDDLVHWERRPIALSPEPDGPDADGCYSGCVVVIDGVATMFYTGAAGPPGRSQIQTTCVARSDHGALDRWTKDPANPVTRAPEGIRDDSFRDPFVWRDGDRWMQMVGAAIPDSGGAALLFESRDLVTWDPLPPLLTAAELSGDEWTGDMWECPALLRTDGGDALLVSVHDGEQTTHHPVTIVGSRRAVPRTRRSPRTASA
jgi:beta-fructofuranosidase